MKYHVNVNRHRSMDDTLILFQPGECSPAQADGRIYLHTRDAACIATRIALLTREDRPKVVTLCGSTRFSHAFQAANLEETLHGNIVLTIGCDLHSDTALFEPLSDAARAALKQRLDDLHKRKIDISDEVLILNQGGYIGDSTRSELEYARAQGKTIRWLEPDHAED